MKSTKKIKLSKNDIKKMLDTEKKFLSKLSKSKIAPKQVESRTRRFLAFIKKVVDTTIYTTLIINAISICIVIFLNIADPVNQNAVMFVYGIPNLALFIFVTLPSLLLKMLLKSY